MIWLMPSPFSFPSLIFIFLLFFYLSNLIMFMILSYLIFTILNWKVLLLLFKIIKDQAVNFISFYWHLWLEYTIHWILRNSMLAENTLELLNVPNKIFYVFNICLDSLTWYKIPGSSFLSLNLLTVNILLLNSYSFIEKSRSLSFNWSYYLEV